MSDFRRPPGGTAGNLGTRDATLRTLCGFGAPVPPGFAISDLACRRFVETGDFPESMWEQVVDGVGRIDRAAAAEIDPARPCLLAVRSSTPVDMPGLMGAALYLGVTAATLEGLAAWRTLSDSRDPPGSSPGGAAIYLRLAFVVLKTRQ